MKKILILLLIILLFPTIIQAEELILAPKATSAILIEYSSGEIIYQKEAHKRIAPASMTKILSIILILEEIKKGNMIWNEMIKVSAEASGMGGTQIFLETGEEMSVRDLFKGIVVSSANDATVALAERIAGTEQAFVARMNEKVRELGLKNTQFKNSHGLDEKDHYSSAYDIAIMSKELLRHEEIFEFSTIYEDYLRQNTPRKVWLVNSNKLLRLYKGVDGLKTGFTDAAKSCLTVTAKRNNMRLIAVVMGALDTATRNDEAIKMLDYGYNQYEVDSIISKNNSLGKVEIIKGRKKYVEAFPLQEGAILNKRGQTNRNNITYDYQVNKVEAPVKKGDVIGKILIRESGKIIKEIPLIAGSAVDRANILDLFFRNLKDILSGDINF